MRTRFEQRSDLERITPGTFQESANGSRVFFIDKEDDNPTGKSAGDKDNAKKNKEGVKLDGNDKLSKEVEKFANSRSNIFISTVSNGKESVTTAREGRIESRNGSQYLLLNNGQRSEIDSKTGQIKVSEFEEYGNLIKSAKLTPFEGGPSKAMSSVALLANRTNGNMGELAWRLGLAFAAVNFIILGAAIANGNPRAGRGASFAFALLAFMFYYNLINLSQSWIASGQFRFTALILMMHGGIFIISALWLAKRHNNWSFLAALKHRKTVKASLLKAAT
jgi:lipopolysaccharide export system permease protein